MLGIDSDNMVFTGNKDKPIQLLEKTDHKYLVADCPTNYEFETAVLCDEIGVCFKNDWVKRDGEMLYYSIEHWTDNELHAVEEVCIDAHDVLENKRFEIFDPDTNFETLDISDFTEAEQRKMLGYHGFTEGEYEVLKVIDGYNCAVMSCKEIDEALGLLL